MASTTGSAVTDTPIRNNGRTQATNLRASAEHVISDEVVQVVQMDRYVELARAAFDGKKWADIAKLEDTDEDGNKTRTAIGTALDALRAVFKRDKQKQSGFREPEYYGPTVRLCNLISLAVFDALHESRPADERDVACIFASAANSKPSGDILNLLFQPDYHGFFGARGDLEFAISQALYKRLVCWPEIGWVGEHKKRHGGSGQGQLKSYVMAAKRARPDIPTVQGFVVHKGKIQLAQGNASGMWCSSPAGIDKIDSWIAFVVLLYQSYAHRDWKLVYNAQQEEFVRWDFTESTPTAAPAPGNDDSACVPGSPDVSAAAPAAAPVTASVATPSATASPPGSLSPAAASVAVPPMAAASPTDPLVLFPFYVAHAPGRVTFATYQVASGPVSQDQAAKDFYSGEVKGFWKTSWQQKSTDGRANERQLLDRLHAGGAWLPGLVRPYPATHGDRLQIPTPNDIIQRARDVIVKRTQEPGLSDRTDADEVADTAGDPDPGAESHERNGESNASSGYASGCTAGSDSEMVDESEVTEDEDADSNLKGTEDEDADNSRPSIPASLTAPVGRVQEIVHLASIGEPLSQCRTPRELLEVIYDLLQVHIHMWDQGVLHRDLSWFNVLINPKHYIGNGDETKPQPCIKSVLYGLGPADDLSKTTSGTDFSPTVLVTDLDHAIEKERLPTSSDSNKSKNSRDRTGTPMFISSELSEPEAWKYIVVGASELNFLEQQLTLVDKLDAIATEALRRAFPDDDGQFMSVFEKVLLKERSRQDWAPLSARPVHRPRHDAETTYWILLWALGRARPQGSAGETEKRLKALGKLGECLLEHEVGEESSRSKYITDPIMLEGLLHTELAELQPLLRAMATYLAIPWHIYPEVNDDHVHVAFRRLILGYLLSRDKDVIKALGVALDTQKPRPIPSNSKKPPTERKKSPWSWGTQSSVGGSGRASLLDMMPPSQGKAKGKGKGKGKAPANVIPSESPPLPDSAASTSHIGHLQSGASASSTASKKRKREGTADESAKKRTKTGPGAASSKAPQVGPSKEEKEELARNAVEYQHDLHFDSRSAHGLRLKVWKDRNLWFSKGHQSKKKK